MKKRIIAWVCVGLLIISATIFALADGNALSLLTSAKRLAFDTGNVSLKANARFTYDGVMFKEFNGDYRQNGENSYMRVMLSTPKANGDTYTGGYTVVGNGDKAYSNDTYFGNYYVETPLNPCGAILRETPMTRAGMAVLEGAAKALSGELDAIIQKTADDGGAEYAISFSSVPDLVNAAVTYIALDYIGKNYYFYDQGDYCRSEFEDMDALISYYYKHLYDEDIPEGILDGTMPYDSAEWDKYNRAYDALYATCNARVAEYDSGVVWQKADGGFEWFPDQEAYLRASEIDYVYYDDYGAAVKAYYASITGEEMTDEMRAAIDNTTNEELWEAYIEMTSEMEANYARLAAQNAETVAITVKNDGSYVEMSVLPSSRDYTVTQTILSTIERIEFTSADVKVKEDAQGNLISGAGVVKLALTDKDGGEHTLDVEFNCEASDYGSTSVGEFNPEDYGLVSYDQFMRDAGVDEYFNDPAAYQAMMDAIPETIEFLGETYETLTYEYYTR